MRILQKTDRKINIVGIDDHELTGLEVVTAVALFDTQKGPMPTFDPSDLIGRTFLLPPEENGERHRAKVTRKILTGTIVNSYKTLTLS